MRPIHVFIGRRTCRPGRPARPTGRGIPDSRLIFDHFHVLSGTTAPHTRQTARSTSRQFLTGACDPIITIHVSRSPSKKRKPRAPSTLDAQGQPIKRRRGRPPKNGYPPAHAPPSVPRPPGAVVSGVAARSRGAVYEPPAILPFEVHVLFMLRLNWAETLFLDLSRRTTAFPRICRAPHAARCAFRSTQMCTMLIAVCNPMFRCCARTLTLLLHLRLFFFRCTMRCRSPCSQDRWQRGTRRRCCSTCS